MIKYLILSFFLLTVINCDKVKFEETINPQVSLKNLDNEQSEDLFDGDGTMDVDEDDMEQPADENQPPVTEVNVAGIRCDNGNERKVKICHRDKTLCVGKASLKNGHVMDDADKHGGDYLGACFQ